MTGLEIPRPPTVSVRAPRMDLAFWRRLAWLVLPFAVVLGYVVGTSSVDRLVLFVLLAVWIAAAIARQVVAYVFVANVTLLVLLPHVFANMDMQLWWLLAIGGQCGLALIATRSFPLHREDLGMVVLLAAAAWPYAVGGAMGTLPGALLGPLFMYATGRLSGTNLRRLAILLLVLGAVHAVVAIAEWSPSLADYVPFSPMRNGFEYNTSRAVGFFNNPNTLGTVETAIILFVITFEPRRWVLPLVAVCAAGILLSGSRESLIGLVVGVGLLSLSRFGRLAQSAVVIALGLFVTAQAFPNVLDRFDVAGYANDPSFIARLSQWQAAIDFISHSVAMGYGVSIPLDAVDNAYLGWLLTGGAIGLAIWVCALLLITPRPLLPLLVAMACISLLANPFSGPAFTVFLIACGAVASSRDREAKPPTAPAPGKAPEAKAPEAPQQSAVLASAEASPA